MNETFLEKKLDERKQQNAFRTLRLPSGKIDFCSNDYLGLSKLSTENQQHATGSTGSRLLAGNYPLIERVETQIAAFHQSDAVLTIRCNYAIIWL